MKRLPIIRHIRYWWLRYQVYRWAWHWGQIGIGMGYPNEADLRQLERIWRGDE
jgi:hypothetical protein